MIDKPSIDQLDEKADSIYTLVIMASQRAKQINDNGTELLLDEDEYINKKPLTRSLQELASGKLEYKKNSDITYR